MMKKPPSRKLDTVPKQTEEQGTTKRSILVMDDDQIIRILATGMIEHLGFAATACSGGEEAVALYRKAREAGTPFMAVILDLEIEDGMGGRDTAREILALDPDAHLVISSGNHHDPAITDFKSYGFCCVMPKPYLLSDISKVLAHLANLLKVTKPERNPLG
jgi:two-component system, cell cycle sensor histidine kinase and response regulator CckA